MEEAIGEQDDGFAARNAIHIPNSGIDGVVDRRPKVPLDLVWLFQHSRAVIFCLPQNLEFVFAKLGDQHSVAWSHLVGKRHSELVKITYKLAWCIQQAIIEEQKHCNWHVDWSKVSDLLFDAVFVKVKIFLLQVWDQSALSIQHRDRDTHQSRINTNDIVRADFLAL
jgi:hypothetical protein